MAGLEDMLASLSNDHTALDAATESNVGQLLPALYLKAATGTPSHDPGRPLFSDMRYGDILEITGRAGVGKTALLQHVAAVLALPRTQDGFTIGGHAQQVYYVDVDKKLCPCRLKQIVTGTLEATGVSGACVGQAVDEALKRIRVLAAHNSTHFLLVLHKLLWKLQQAEASTPQKRVVIIDSISAFWWVWRASTRPNVDVDWQERELCRVVQGLSALSAVIVSKQQFFSNPKNEHREFMSRGWQSLVRHCYSIHRDEVAFYLVHDRSKARTRQSIPTHGSANGQRRTQHQHPTTSTTTPQKRVVTFHSPPPPQAAPPLSFHVKTAIVWGPR